MPVLRQLGLSRRLLLRGGAASLALPWLDAMAPAVAPRRAARRRAVFIYAPNGVNVRAWRPDGSGTRAQFGATLAPLEQLRDRLTVFSGLAIDGGRAHGDGAGDHARSVASFLTCAHPRKTGGADIHVGTSVDQVIAQQIGDTTPFASLELGLERGRSAGTCDSGYSCAYSNNISWRSATTPVPKETDPRAVFERLFGDPEGARDREAKREQRDRDRSVLDLVLADAKSLRARLGAGDRAKLDQYLQSVRELETRMARLDTDADAAEREQVEVPSALLQSGRRHADRIALMYDLIELALSTEQTRVVSLMLGNGGSNRSYRFLGVPEGHHDLSHHGKQADKMAAIAKIDRFHVEQLARFLNRLAARPDGDADLLHRCLVVYGSGIGDGNRHNHDHLPVVLAGEGAGAAAARGHVRFDRETPLANLYLAIIHALGGRDVAFADSTEALAL